MVKKEGDFTIVGDIHGQFYDMMSMMDEFTPHLKRNKTKGMVFLGNYINRGAYNLEVLAYLLTLKINFENQIVLLRGNHETRQMAEAFQFKKECLEKYDQETYEKIMELFDFMPLACVINKLYLCVHGGIPKDTTEIADIEKLERFKEPEREGPISDILWSDPCEDDDKVKDLFFVENVARNSGQTFGLKAVEAILKKECLLSIIRSGQV